jgi:hypothetical protein
MSEARAAPLVEISPEEADRIRQRRAPASSRLQEAPTERPGQAESLSPPPRDPKAQSFAERLWSHMTSTKSPGETILSDAGDFARKALLPRWAGGTDPAGGGMFGREGGLNKLGDVGTFASGGLQNPLAVEGHARALGRGADVQPRVAQVPQPGLRLPPPEARVPGEPPVSTGQGFIPGGPEGRVGLREGVPGPPSPLQPSPEARGPPQVPPGQLALPPPTVGVPGGPGTPTGPGRPMGPQGPIPFAPPPARGLIPGSQPGTMRTVPPGAPPLVRPGAIPDWMNRPSTAQLAGAAAGRDLPPRAPGVGGRADLSPERQARQPPPLIAPDAHIGEPSSIASAFATNNPNLISETLSTRFRQTMKPGRQGQQPGQRGIDQQNMRITTAADTIIEAKDSLRYRDPKDLTGQSFLPGPGRLPRTLGEFAQTIEFLKSEIFKQYDYLAKQVGGQGARIDLGPTIAKLRELATRPEIGDINAPIRQQALEMAETWAQRGSYSPEEAQNVIQSLNAQLRNHLSGKATQEIYSHPTLMNEVRDTLLTNLNQTMEGALGGSPQYASLRNRYGALTSIERDVGNALGRQLSRTPGKFEKAFNWAEVGGLALSGMHFDPKIFGSVVAADLGKRAWTYLNSENRAVSQMFSKRANEAARPYSMTERASASAAVKLGEMRQERFDANRIGNIDYLNKTSRPYSRAQSTARSLNGGQ